MDDTAAITPGQIRKIVSLIDLTNLNDHCDQAAIEVLCTQTETPAGRVAAVCVWPSFVAAARLCLGKHSPVEIATVVNFPGGDEDLQTTCAAIDNALHDGATEIDYVLCYKKLIDGDTTGAGNALKEVRQQTPDHIQLKVILETGVLKTDELIRNAAQIALDQGADFIKTSTGKVPVNATPQAATLMFDAIEQSKRHAGFKAAGGIKSIDDAIVYTTMAEERFGADWVVPANFRFGASSLLKDALNKLGDDGLQAAASQQSDY